ncbi:hypothetical protein [Gracilibacillus sp. YIM 98692]|uniref:hypothetical protein n=1 Tax=Gracilibacillus sp. YIM 98692 TaxID=2663532 RepID=UPI0013D3C34D|nr:hypothetical protein [Gracilibacillus sp. YIM 98692]
MKYEEHIKDIQIGREYIKKDCIYIINRKEYHPTCRFMEVTGLFYSFPWWYKCKITLKKELQTNRDSWKFHHFSLWNSEKKQYESVLNFYSYLLLDPIKTKILKQIREEKYVI